mmetsp:Transcript_45980/g.141627  ORF Transcript_45980/g.141627 Transcript_45980/m.141627 type:complete len:227 (+) Transcript_45980:203-883(+)
MAGEEGRRLDGDLPQTRAFRAPEQRHRLREGGVRVELRRPAPHPAVGDGARHARDDRDEGGAPRRQQVLREHGHRGAVPRDQRRLRRRRAVAGAPRAGAVPQGQSGGDGRDLRPVAQRGASGHGRQRHGLAARGAAVQAARERKLRTAVCRNGACLHAQGAAAGAPEERREGGARGGEATEGRPVRARGEARRRGADAPVQGNPRRAAGWVYGLRELCGAERADSR